MCLIARSCPTLCDLVDCSPPGSTVRGNFHARILEWVTSPISRGSSPPRDRTPISNIVVGFFTIWATRETLYACDELATYCYCSHDKQSYLPLHIGVLVGSDEGLTSLEPALSPLSSCAKRAEPVFLQASELRQENRVRNSEKNNMSNN